MDKRIIAIQYENENARQNAIKLVDAFIQFKIDCQLLVFKKNGLDSFVKDGIEEISLAENLDNSSKIKNSILDFAKNKCHRGFLHIVEDSIELLKDPSKYIDQIEHTMDALDYSIHFSTVTDPCNYVFKKFNPRLTLEIDDDDIKQKLSLPSLISFTSHSNTCWTIYDFNKTLGDVQRYDERFTIAMYQIIEYLARRRATKKDGQLYYMNQYLSIGDEIGVFKALEGNGKQIQPKDMQKEDEIFKSIQIDFSPDNNIDIVLDTFYQKIKQKLAING